MVDKKGQSEEKSDKYKTNLKCGIPISINQVFVCLPTGQ
jgi:hypothetical protein